jgi:DNA-binding transcriptional MerR regulator
MTNSHPADRQVFTTTEMAALLRVPVNEVDYWVRCKLITPHIRQASGQGSRRLFGWSDLREAFLIKRLRNARWKPKQIGKALRTVIAAMKNPASLPAPLLIHEGGALLILCRSGSEITLLDASSPGQYVMVIALDTLEEETRRQLARSK